MDNTNGQMLWMQGPGSQQPNTLENYQVEIDKLAVMIVTLFNQ